MTEWGKWECPRCGEEHSDPDYITITSCRECDATIIISAPDDDGQMDTIFQVSSPAWIKSPLPG